MERMGAGRKDEQERRRGARLGIGKGTEDEKGTGGREEQLARGSARVDEGSGRRRSMNAPHAATQQVAAERDI